MINSVVFRAGGDPGEFIEAIAALDGGCEVLADYLSDRLENLEHFFRHGTFDFFSEGDDATAGMSDAECLDALSDPEINRPFLEHSEVNDHDWLELSWTLRYEHPEIFRDVLLIFSATFCSSCARAARWRRCARGTTKVLPTVAATDPLRPPRRRTSRRSEAKVIGRLFGMSESQAEEDRRVAIFDDRPFFERALVYGCHHGIIDAERLQHIRHDAPKGMVQIAEYFGTQYLRANIEEARLRMVNLVSLYLEDRSISKIAAAATWHAPHVRCATTLSCRTRAAAPKCSSGSGRYPRTAHMAC